MKIELTEQEATALLELVDTGLKQHGIRALGCANMVVDKIKCARLQEQNEKTLDIAPPTGITTAQG